MSEEKSASRASRQLLAEQEADDFRTAARQLLAEQEADDFRTGPWSYPQPCEPLHYSEPMPPPEPPPEPCHYEGYGDFDNSPLLTVGSLRVYQESFLGELHSIGVALQRSCRDEVVTMCDQVRQDIRQQFEDRSQLGTSLPSRARSLLVRNSHGHLGEPSPSSPSSARPLHRSSACGDERSTTFTKSKSVRHATSGGSSFAKMAQRQATAAAASDGDAGLTRGSGSQLSLRCAADPVAAKASTGGDRIDSEEDDSVAIAPAPPDKVPPPRGGQALLPDDQPPDLPLQAAGLPSVIPEDNAAAFLGLLNETPRTDSDVASVKFINGLNACFGSSPEAAEGNLWSGNGAGGNNAAEDADRNDKPKGKPALNRGGSALHLILDDEDEKEKRIKNKGVVEVSKLSLGKEVSRRNKSKTDGKPLWHMSAKDILGSSKFDNMIGSLILVNAVTIGVQTDIMARDVTDEPPEAIQHIEKIFLLAFSCELSLRLYVFGRGFFHSGDLYWNWFDFIVVTLQLMEELLLVIAKLSDQDASGQSSASDSPAAPTKMLRVLRILRLMRILRVMRILRLISELRTIVSSIAGSMQSLGWTIVLLTLFIYIVAVYLTQSVNDHMVELTRDQTSWEQDLRLYFGSLPRSTLSLYQAMSGGLDWDTLASPLINMNWLVGFALVAYIAFAILALMNVVTGVFVQTALQSAKNEEDKFLTDQIVRLFKDNVSKKRVSVMLPNSGTDGETFEESDVFAGRINWEAVNEALTDPNSAKEWKAIDVNPEEAKYLFNLLDIEQAGEVSFEEFLSGCLRLHGGAKAVDLLTVMQELRSFFVKHGRCHDDTASLLEALATELLHQGDINQNMNSELEQLRYDLSGIATTSAEQQWVIEENREQLQDLQSTAHAIERHMGSLHALNDLLNNVDSPAAAEQIVNSGHEGSPVNVEQASQDLV